MLIKFVALLTMISMSINGFLPKSITDLSGNSFLVDAIACQSVFLDFLHFSDKSLVEIAVVTVDELSVATPLSAVDAREVSSNPWTNVCRTLTQSTEQLTLMGGGQPQKAAPAQSKNADPLSPSMDNTSSDYILLNNATRMDVVARYVSRGFLLTTGGVCLVVTRLLSVGGERQTLCPASVLGSSNGYQPRLAVDRICGLGRDIPVFMAGHFSSFLPRSGIDASVIMNRIL
jgi:hypothetical protein